MPDLSKCKFVNGKLCCWDRETNVFYHVALSEIFAKAEIAEITDAFIEDDCEPDTRRRGRR